MTRLSATTGISNRGAQLATQSRRPTIPKAATDFTPKADLQALLTMHVEANLGSQVSSGRLLSHQLNLQLASDCARVPLERC